MTPSRNGHQPQNPTLGYFNNFHGFFCGGGKLINMENFYEPVALVNFACNFAF